jgi:hypothetical protein
MLTRTHAWSSSQKLLIMVGSAVLIALSGIGIYIYERYYRGPSDSVLVGTWQIEDGCIDCTNFIALQPNHSLIGFGDTIAGQNQLESRGRWYAGGQLLVIHYDTTEKAGSVIMRILDIAPETIRVRWDGREIRMTRSTRIPPQASNQPLERTTDRRENLLPMTSTLKLEAALALDSGRSACSR